MLPVILNNNNFASGAPGEPTLLSFDDAQHAVPRVRPRAARPADARSRYPSQSRHLRAPRLRRVARRRSTSTGWRCRRRCRRACAATSRPASRLPEALLDTHAGRADFRPGLRYGRLFTELGADRHGDPCPTDPGSIDLGAFERDARPAAGMPAEVGTMYLRADFKNMFSACYAAVYGSDMWSASAGRRRLRRPLEAGDVSNPSCRSAERILTEPGQTCDLMEPYVSFCVGN